MEYENEDKVLMSEGPWDIVHYKVLNGTIIRHYCPKDHLFSHPYFRHSLTLYHPCPKCKETVPTSIQTIFRLYNGR